MMNTDSRTKIAAVKFDPAKYRRLVSKAMPAVMETEAENERLLAIVEPMMRRDLSPEEAKLFDLLVKLIEDFEERHYPMGQDSSE
ncbi:MAG: transcriptional regulator [Acidobacteriota bacterium]